LNALFIQIHNVVKQCVCDSIYDCVCVCVCVVIGVMLTVPRTVGVLWWSL